MSFYASKFAAYFKKRTRKWLISFLMVLHRWLTGYVTDTLFDFVNFFGKRPAILPPVQNPLLLDTAMGLAAKIRNKQVSCACVVRAYLRRMEEVQPVVNAVVEARGSEALQEAAQLDRWLEVGVKTQAELQRDLPLLGVPLSVKEAIGVAGMLQTTGWTHRRGTRATEDAEVVRRLRAAGAIPVAVTNTSEQCFWMETYNNLHGRTNNPYDTRRTAGGSSGGEGALLASAGSVVGIGNDIGGSIRMPSFYNGVFGHKPSRGMVPNEGAFPITEKILQPYIGTGPMCRFASDLLPMLRVMAGPNATLLQLDKDVSLKDLKFYYMEDDGNSNFTTPSKPDVREAVRKVVSHFRSVCSVPPQKVLVRGLRHGFKVWGHALSAGVVDVASIESRVFGAARRSAWRELLLCLVGCSDYSFPVLVTVLVEKYIGPKDKSAAEPFTRIQRHLECDLQNLLQDDCVFVLPTLPEGAPYHYVNTMRAQNCGYVAAFNVLGLPATHCPVTQDARGMPVGVQVVSGLRNDRLNLAVAREIERAFGGWVSPGPIV